MMIPEEGNTQPGGDGASASSAAKTATGKRKRRRRRNTTKANPAAKVAKKRGRKAKRISKLLVIGAQKVVTEKKEASVKVLQAAFPKESAATLRKVLQALSRRGVISRKRGKRKWTVGEKVSQKANALQHRRLILPKVSHSRSVAVNRPATSGVTTSDQIQFLSKLSSALSGRDREIVNSISNVIHEFSDRERKFREFLAAFAKA